MRVDTALGRIDLFKYLESKEGLIELNLIDAGMERPISSKYEYRLVDDEVLIKRIMPRGRNDEVRINRYVNLTPNFIVFIGMYDGDGNKTNNIGFAQNEQQLQNFVTENLKLIFNDAFEEELTILEDLQYFQAGPAKEKFDQIKSRNSDLEDREIYEKILEQEFIERFREDLPSHIKYVISPLKGARSPGQSSYEIIRNLKNSRNFLPLFLSITKDLISTVIKDQQFLDNDPEKGIEWFGNPKSYSPISMDSKKFVEEQCIYATTSDIKKYEIVSETNNELVLKKTHGSNLRVRKDIPLTPLTCVFLGLYWAEGTTAKSKIFTFHESPETLALGFNSSEDISINLFLEGMQTIFPHLDDFFAYWIVKIGTKYFPESNALGFKLGIPVHRAGYLGQGISKAIEVTEEIGNWGVQQSEDMRTYRSYYKHIEFTGNGIPRIDLRCKSAACVFLFSMMRKLSYEKDSFEDVLNDN